MRFSDAGRAALCCRLALLGILPAAAQTAPEPLLLIVDGSAAMNQSAGGVRKIDIARKALQEAISEFPGNVPLGMIAFGHRTAADCGDVEVVEDIESAAKDRRERLTRRLATLTPRGRSSLARALLEALRVFRGRPGRVLLVVGGADGCGRDPCVVAETLRQSFTPLRADVVVIGAAAEEAAVSCIGVRLGGRSAAAATAEAARRAIAAAALGGMPGGRLRVGVSQAGRPQPSAPYVTVYQNGKTVEQLGGNPCVFQLPAGDYEVSARLGPHSESRRIPVKISNGQTTVQTIAIATGVLVVSLTRPRGRPFSPTPMVELIRGEDYVAGARSLPARFEAGAGTYSLRVTLNSRQQYIARGLVIEAARSIERAVEVPAAQVEIHVSGRRYQGAVRPFVEIYQSDRFVASHSGSPALLQLLPGSYSARVREGGRSIANRTFQVTGGEDLRIDLNVP